MNLYGIINDNMILNKLRPNKLNTMVQQNN